MNTRATTLQQVRPFLPVRLFNGFGALLEKTRIPSNRVFAADLIETAKRRCGLDDFGEGDFFEALSRLLESCQSEARLNLIGKIALRTDVLQTLCSRLQMERDRQLYPNIARQEIREPLFIVGLPRSGTTVLHSLLAADPEHRSPLMWEVRAPSPPTRSGLRSPRLFDCQRDICGMTDLSGSGRHDQRRHAGLCAVVGGRVRPAAATAHANQQTTEEKQTRRAEQRKPG